MENPISTNIRERVYQARVRALEAELGLEKGKVANLEAQLITEKDRSHKLAEEVKYHAARSVDVYLEKAKPITDAWLKNKKYDGIRAEDEKHGKDLLKKYKIKLESPVPEQVAK